MIPTSGQPASSSRLERLRDRRDERQLSRWETWIGSSPSRTPGLVGGRGDPAQTVDDELARLGLVAAAGRACQADDAVRPIAGEPVHRRA